VQDTRKARRLRVHRKAVANVCEAMSHSYFSNAQSEVNSAGGTTRDTSAIVKAKDTHHTLYERENRLQANYKQQVVICSIRHLWHADSDM
jgi:hypothetical protein